MAVKRQIKQGLQASFPIFVGYLSASLAFGFLASGGGLRLIEAMLFSLITFTGAAQFMAIRLIRDGVSPQVIILSYFLVNLRYFLMSSSLVQRIRFSHPTQRFLLALGVTDENFSVASLREGDITPLFMGITELVPWIGWNLGTVLGFLFGSILPSSLQQSMEGSLYALFAALLVPEVKKGWRVVVIIAFAAITNTVLSLWSPLSEGWSFILAMVGATILGTVMELKHE